MKKYIKVIVLSIVCIGIIVGYYYYLTYRDKKDIENSTELTKVGEVLAKDLEKDYPPTPREVIKFYDKILKCYYNEEYEQEELEEMADQARLLMDEELLKKNPKDQYMLMLEADIKDYKDNERKLVDTTVCDSKEVEYKKVDGRECAYVVSRYFVREGNTYSNSSQKYVLRKDEDGNWKILGFKMVEGESSYD